MIQAVSYDITTMPVIQSQYRAIEPYVTKDGSEIRELMHPTVHGNRQQSLAEATVAPGAQTALHQETGQFSFNFKMRPSRRARKRRCTRIGLPRRFIILPRAMA